MDQRTTRLAIVSADISTVGSQCEAHGVLRHVFLPLPARGSLLGPDVLCMPGDRPYAMVTFPAAWPTAQRHGPRERVVQDKAALRAALLHTQHARKSSRERRETGNNRVYVLL